MQIDKDWIAYLSNNFNKLFALLEFHYLTELACPVSPESYCLVDWHGHLLSSAALIVALR